MHCYIVIVQNLYTKTFKTLLHVSILRSSSGSTYCSLLKFFVKKDKYFIICFGDAAAYHVYVYMLYSLQGGLSTLDRPPCKEYNMYTYTRYAAASPKHKVFIFLTYNFSKEQYVLPEDDLRIERCRNVLNVSV